MLFGGRALLGCVLFGGGLGGGRVLLRRVLLRRVLFGGGLGGGRVLLGRVLFSHFVLGGRVCPASFARGTGLLNGT